MIRRLAAIAVATAGFVAEECWRRGYALPVLRGLCSHLDALIGFRDTASYEPEVV